MFLSVGNDDAFLFRAVQALYARRSLRFKLGGLAHAATPRTVSTLGIVWVILFVAVVDRHDRGR